MLDGTVGCDGAQVEPGSAAQHASLCPAATLRRCASARAAAACGCTHLEWVLSMRLHVFPLQSPAERRRCRAISEGGTGFIPAWGTSKAGLGLDLCQCPRTPQRSQWDGIADRESSAATAARLCGDGGADPRGARRRGGRSQSAGRERIVRPRGVRGGHGELAGAAADGGPVQQRWLTQEGGGRRGRVSVVNWPDDGQLSDGEEQVLTAVAAAAQCCGTVASAPVPATAAAAHRSAHTARAAEPPATAAAARWRQ